MKSIVTALLLCCFALICGFVVDDVAIIQADSAREITVLRCEADTLREHFRAELMREQHKHEIELRNLDAAIHQQASERLMELMDRRDTRGEPRRAHPSSFVLHRY